MLRTLLKDSSCTATVSCASHSSNPDAIETAVNVDCENNLQDEERSELIDRDLINQQSDILGPYITKIKWSLKNWDHVRKEFDKMIKSKTLQ